YRNCSGGPLNGARVNIRAGENHVGRGVNQCRHGLGNLLCPNIKAARHDREILTLDETVKAQFIQKQTDRWCFPSEGDQEPNPICTALLLCRRDEWPRRRAAETRDELAPFHSITSSARASRECGTSRPSALAVLRLMTSSNLTGACTGRSLGF